MHLTDRGARSAAISTSDDATSYVSMAREEICACM